MRKGFTLIELLAVIVILAVLALIATPIVLNIIDDSKKNATLRSSENYIKAVEFSIAKSVMENKKLSDGTYQLMESGNICLGTKTGSACDNELVVEVSGETPESGTITIKSRKIDSYEFTYASGFVVINGKIDSEAEGSNLTLAQFIIKQSKDNNYYYTTTPNFANDIVDGEYGLYQAPDDLGISYYFRGDTEDNYVRFGEQNITVDEVWQACMYSSGGSCYSSSYDSEAECLSRSGFMANQYEYCVLTSSGGNKVVPVYWRIVRINGDGSIRLIYDSTFDEYYVSTKTTLIERLSDIISSTDNWYANFDKKYEKYLGDSTFCYDNEPYETGDSGTLYKSAERMALHKPKLTCADSYDHFSAPVGLITVDEVVMAGQNSYLFNESSLTYTPHLDHVEYDYSSEMWIFYQDGIGLTSPFYKSGQDEGYFTYGGPNNIRPVINLKADVSFTGDGSYDNPYVIVTE